jgi:hypothetical protein
MPLLGCKIIKHTEEEKAWAKEKCESLPKITAKTIIELKVCEEYFTKFNKTLTATGMYTWLRFVKYPEIKKEAYARRNERLRAERNGEERPNATLLREKETFEKANILAYINHNIVGFDTDEELKAFLIKNSIVAPNISVFKRIAIRIEYNVTIGA